MNINKDGIMSAKYPILGASGSTYIARFPAQSQQFAMASANFALSRSTSVFASLDSFSMTPWSVITARFSLSLKNYNDVYERNAFSYSSKK